MAAASVWATCEVGWRIGSNGKGFDFLGGMFQGFFEIVFFGCVLCFFFWGGVEGFLGVFL